VSRLRSLIRNPELLATSMATGHSDFARLSSISHKGRTAANHEMYFELMISAMMRW
jgi:hypothetical protein